MIGSLVEAVIVETNGSTSDVETWDAIVKSDVENPTEFTVLYLSKKNNGSTLNLEKTKEHLK